MSKHPPFSPFLSASQFARLEAYRYQATESIVIRLMSNQLNRIERQKRIEEEARDAILLISLADLSALLDEIRRLRMMLEDDGK